MRILLTGFEPFGGLDVNPSQRIVEALAQQSAVLPGVALVTGVLPTEFRTAGARIVALIRAHRPDAVVGLGLAASTPQIRLERIAVNVNDSIRPDNGGDLATGRLIEPGGPVGYWSTLPLERMLEALRGRDIPSVISNHAGAYVCNHVFYSARHEIERRGWTTPCGFIHVPLIAEEAAPAPAVQTGLPLTQMVEAVASCLRILAAC